jgi:cytochrome c peroxidase
MVQLTRRSPTILNLAWAEALFWDGRAATLEQQARGPISSPNEMNMPLAALGAKIAAIPGYRPLFERAYPDEGITVQSITRAIATFERSVVSHRSPFDRWVEGDDQALSAAERRGLDVFVGPGRCVFCHTGWNMTDNQFHDTGLTTTDLGRGAVEPERLQAQHAFKTPSLRDTERRAPYMHDGSLPTLDAVVRFYEVGGMIRPSRSAQIQPLALSNAQRNDLLAFLRTLTAPPQEFASPSLPR